MNEGGPRTRELGTLRVAVIALRKELEAYRITLNVALRHGTILLAVLIVLMVALLGLVGITVHTAYTAREVAEDVRRLEQRQQRTVVDHRVRNEQLHHELCLALEHITDQTDIEPPDCPDPLEEPK